MAKQDLTEQDDPLGLESIKTLVDIEANQRSLSKTVSENLIVAGLGILSLGLSKIFRNRKSSIDIKIERILKQAKAQAEINKILKKHGFTPKK